MSIRNFIARLCKGHFFASKPQPNEKDNAFEINLRNFERYISFMQNVLLWKNPIISVLCIFATNIVFWLVSRIDWHVFGTIGLVLLGSTLRDVWTTHIWPEIRVRPPPPPPAAPLSSTPSPPSVAGVGKLVEACRSSLCEKLALLLQLRRQQPAVFCCVSLVSWFCLLLLGRSVSGSVLLYLSLMAAMTGPGVYVHCLPDQMKTTVAAYTVCVHQAFTKYSDGSRDEDYLPVTTSEDQDLLTRVSNMQQDAEAYDSITNPGSSSDMVSGLGLMPSHEEDSLASLSDLGFGLLPLDPPSHSPSPSSHDSDSNKSDRRLKFQSGHFNEGSSSDEEAFARDLEFGAADDVVAAPGTGALSSLISRAVAGNVGFLAGALRRTASNQPASQLQRRSSSDDDFEVINRDELSNS